MKRRLMVVAVISILCAVTHTHNISSNSGMERSFTQRFGAHGYLLLASNRYANYEFEKERCCERRKKTRTKRKKRQYEDDIETRKW